MKCEIIKDLLPSYVDGLTSPESNHEIEEHFKSCPQCQEVYDQMKAELEIENTELNEKEIKPFKKLNKKVYKAVFATVVICALAVGAWFYFFGFGWKVHSEDMNIQYSYVVDPFTDGKIQFEFELTNGRVLNAWVQRDKENIHGLIYVFTESFHSILDDRGEYPSKFSLGIHYPDSSGNYYELTEDHYVILKFKDRTETIYLKDIAEELGIIP